MRFSNNEFVSSNFGRFTEPNCKICLIPSGDIIDTNRMAYRFATIEVGNKNRILPPPAGMRSNENCIFNIENENLRLYTIKSRMIKDVRFTEPNYKDD